VVPTSQPAPVASHAPSPPPSPHQPILLCLPAPAGAELGGQTSEVSEDAAVAADSPPLTSEAPTSAALTSEALTADVDFSPEQLREKETLNDALHGDVRPRILLSLAARGPANVGTIADRLGIPHATISDHLGKLKDLGLLFDRREGREKWYEADPERVRCERLAGGRFLLTLVGRGSGAEVSVLSGGNQNG
jgi:DNA-binding transcriptional ArsR family regulator